MNRDLFPLRRDVERPVARPAGGETRGLATSFPRWCLSVVLAVAGDAGRAEDARDVLRQVEARLRPALAGLDPVPVMEQPGSSLVVTHQSRKFMVHGRFKSGEWSTNLVESVGPSAAGFILWVHVEPLGEIHQAVTPQTIQEPYWRTSLDVTPVAGTTNQLYWALSSGGRADEKRLENVRRALQSLALPAAAPKPPPAAVPR